MFFNVIFISALAVGLSLAIPLGLQPRAQDLTLKDIKVGMVLAAWPINMEPKCRPPNMDPNSVSLHQSHPMIVMSITGKVRVSPISNNNPLQPNKDIASIVGDKGLRGDVFIGYLCELDLTGVKIWPQAITLTLPDVEKVFKEIVRAQQAKSKPPGLGKSKSKPLGKAMPSKSQSKSKGNRM
jgi:hypothetical protein